jgi:hypothetical protein
MYKFTGLTKRDENERFQEMESWKEQRDTFMKENGDVWMQEHGYGSYAGARSTSAAKPAAPRVPQPVKQYVDWIEPLPHEQLDKFYRTILSTLVLDPIHKDYLKSEGWEEDLISSSMVRSFPAKDVIRFNYRMYESRNPYRKRLIATVMQRMNVDSLEGYPGAYMDAAGHWTIYGPSGLVLPVYDTEGYIYSLRIRMDYCDISRSMKQGEDGIFYYDHDGIRHYHQPFKGFYTLENGKKIFPKTVSFYDDDGKIVERSGKYRPVTSYFEKEEGNVIKNALRKGCKAENAISVYCDWESDSPSIAYFTEGEKKGIFANEMIGAPVITFPGVSSWRDILKGEPGNRMIDRLYNRGVRTCIVAYDADKETNEMVLRQQNVVAKALQECGFSVGLAQWPEKYGKGLDDLLAHGFFPGFEPFTGN